MSSWPQDSPERRLLDAFLGSPSVAEVRGVRVRFHSAYRNAAGDTERFVFTLTPEIFFVVKRFQGRTVTTVKLWDVASSSLQRTVSYWSTNQPFEPSRADVREAQELAVSLFTIVSKAI